MVKPIRVKIIWDFMVLEFPSMGFLRGAHWIFLFLKKLKLFGAWKSANLKIHTELIEDEQIKFE